MMSILPTTVECNSSLYIQAPLGILSKLLALIPGVGRILNSLNEKADLRAV